MARQKDTKTNAMRILETLDIPYQHFEYECEEFVSGIRMADKAGLPHEIVYKTLVTQAPSKNYYVFVIPIEEEIDFKKAARVVGEKSQSMIPVKEINNVTGYIRGSTTAIGMKKHYVTKVQEDAMLLDIIVVSAGKLGHQLRLAPDDLLRACEGEYADVIK